MKRRALSLVLALACILSVFSILPPAQMQAAESIPDILRYEDYSTAKAFQISTAAGLKKFSDLGQNSNFSGITFYLVADIDMYGVDYTPIPFFSGTLDGGYHAIKRLNVNTTDKSCGLFDMINAAGIVRRLGVEGGTFALATNDTNDRVGTFAGVVKGLVDECWSTATLSAVSTGTVTDISVGGIAGALLNGGIVRNSYFAGQATGVAHAAGIADWCQGQYSGYVGQIHNCFSIGTLVATNCFGLGRYSGSILAANKASAVQNSYYFGDYTDLSWTDEDQALERAWLGNGYLAYLLNGEGSTSIWSKGAMFPELRGNGGVYPISITYKNKGYTFTNTHYFNAGDTYCVQVPDSASVSLSATAGAVNDRTFTVPAQSASLTVTVDLPNVAQLASYPDASAYVITDKTGFSAMSAAVNNGNTFQGKSIYMLGDIDMQMVNHTPIGQFATDWPTSFSGNFYGNHHKVFNLKVDDTTLDGAGLFGSAYKATFVGLHIFNGSVTAANRAGGFVGFADGCIFRYCSNGADITTTTGGDGVGGIVGTSRWSSAYEYCANYGAVTAEAKAAAGIAGWGQTAIKMTGCINTGIITAPSDVAALSRVGAGFKGTWEQCYYLESVCASSRSGIAAQKDDFSCGIVAGNINTTSCTKANNGAYTNTPLYPVLCTENDDAAACTHLYAYEDSVLIGSTTVYGNIGSEVAVTESGDYYGNPSYTMTTALTGEVYPETIVYTISYNLNGGTLNVQAACQYTGAIGAALPLSAEIKKDGYCFAGWYESSALTGQPTAVAGPGESGNKTYYAKWSSVMEIGTVAQYLNFVNAVNGGNSYSDKVVRITADIDFGGQTIDAVGTANAPFSGVLDGNGHTLSNFTVSGNDAQGLIGYLKQGIVRYIKIDNCTVSGKTNVGSLVGCNDSGLILGCESNANVVNTESTVDLSYMSFNIRCGEDASPNTVAERTPRVKTYLSNYLPDIIGLQEVTPTWKTVLSEVLSGYNSEFTYRDAAGKEAAPLYWNKSKFNALEQGTFWLSETPEEISYGWGANYYRTCSYAVLQPKNTNIIILAYNTHLDHTSLLAQIEGIKLVKSRMDAMEKKYRQMGCADVYSFVTGDFNAHPTAEAIAYLSQTMVEARYAAVSLETDVEQGSFSAYHGAASQLIDYIFVSPNTDVKTYKVTLDKVDGQAISDHYGLYGTVRLGGNAHGGIVGSNMGHVQSCGFAGGIDSMAGCGGIAGENIGRIVGSYSSFTPKTSDVFVNGIADGNVYFSCYPAGLSGKGDAVGDMTDSTCLETLNRTVDLWSMNESVNSGLPFICMLHDLSYTDKGDGTHKAECVLCGETSAQSHTAVIDAAVSPSCEAEGKTEGSHCVLCNAVIVPQERIPATGHRYSSKVTTEATCAAPGVRTYTCSSCSHSYTEPIASPAHTYTSKITTAPTCTKEGVKTFTCTDCGDEMTQPIAATGHDYKPVITDPDCTQNGYTTYTCSACNDSYTADNVEALGHTEVIDEAVAPTCTETGLTEGKHCSVCGEVLLAQSVVAALGHSYEADITEATCAEAGIAVYTCACGDSYTQELEILPHETIYVPMIPPTCSEPGVKEHYLCSGCGAIFADDACEYPLPEWYLPIESFGHLCQHIVTEPTCTRNGYTTYICACGESYVSDEVEALGHTEVIDKAVAPTCTETGLTEGKHCSVCNEVLVARGILDALGHTYVCTDNGENHVVTCENCDYNVEEYHKFVDGSCTCGAVESTEPIPDENLKFNMDIVAGAEMVVNYNFMASIVSKYEDFYLEVSKNVAGGEPIVTTYGVSEGHTAMGSMNHPVTGAALMYNAAYNGINAKEMGDNFATTLYAIDANGKVYKGETVVRSIKDYLLGKLEDTSSIPELKTMAVDMLKYGAAAQVNFNYDTENLVTDVLTEEQLALATQEIPEASDDASVTGEGANVNTNITVNSKVELSLSCIVAGQTEVKCIITDADGKVLAERATTNIGGIMYSAVYDNVGASQMREVITATFVNGNGDAISKTVHWSVESYVAQTRARATATEVEIAMVDAMLTYGDAVAAYMDKNA